MVIGSGPIVIGQAAEFDYAGTQACRSLREEGFTTVLVNSNPATIMTDLEMADIVYIEPLTVETVAGIIEKEKVEGVLSGMGGQTALNLCSGTGREGLPGKAERPACWARSRGPSRCRGPGAVQADHDRDRRAGAAQRHRHTHRGGEGGRRVHRRLPGAHPPGLHPGRHRRRHRLQRGGARCPSSAAG